MTLQFPPYIALCGNPRAGKSTAARVLKTIGNYDLVDDGYALRDIAMKHYGLTYDQVHTQAGKLELVTINGEEMTVRDVLGRIGNGFEAEFGPNVIPELAYNRITDGGRYVFGSVRRDQGSYHKARGALVISIVNPLAGPSPYEFDVFNPAYVDWVVENDATALGLDTAAEEASLAVRLEEALAWWRTTQPLAA